MKQFLSEVRYGPTQIAAAKLLASYVPDASIVLDPSLTDRLELIVGVSFPGLVVPAVPPSPVATEAPTTTTAPPAASAGCEHHHDPRRPGAGGVRLARLAGAGAGSLSTS